MTAYVLDSYAIIALQRDEPGAERVAELLSRGEHDDRLYMASVNLGEVLYRTIREADNARAQVMLAEFRGLPIEVIAVDEELAVEGAVIKGAFRISYADCIAAALALRLDATLVTGDRDFEQIPDLNIEWFSVD